jgi:hypothetical protein
MPSKQSVARSIRAAVTPSQKAQKLCLFFISKVFYPVCPLAFGKCLIAVPPAVLDKQKYQPTANRKKSSFYIMRFIF